MFKPIYTDILFQPLILQNTFESLEKQTYFRRVKVTASSVAYSSLLIWKSTVSAGKDE